MFATLRAFVVLYTSVAQQSATSPHVGQTCLFTNFPNILTTIRGSEFKGICEKAGLCPKQSTESPILFRSCGHETPFLTKKGHKKSGIPCSGPKWGLVADGWCGRCGEQKLCDFEARYLRSFSEYV
jgi:hypothetical protein